MKILELHTRGQVCFIKIGELDNIICNNKVLIVTNNNIIGFHKQKLLNKIIANDVFICEIDDGEQYKNMKTLEFILDTAFKYNLDRKSLMIAFGGGVISDMVGFAAGIYKRGIDFINIPTTLLAQVDASIGGKSGINNIFGKNLIGIFNQPRSIHIDMDFLDTLPRREFVSGISEIVKIAVCFDKEFFMWLKNANLFYNKNDLEFAIIKSAKIKTMIVSKDELESDIRIGLNYGHTFGHIIELFGNYDKYLHGECISIGMCMANELAIRLNKLSKEDSEIIKSLLRRFNLITKYKVYDIEKFYRYLFLDKKNINNSLRFIIPVGIGKMEIVENISKELIFEVLSLDYE